MRYILNDTETIGLNPPPVGSGVVQVAWVELDSEARIIGQGSSLVNPGCDIHPEASKVHGLYADDVKDAPNLEDVYKWDDPVVSIGHNTSFDVKFLAPCYSNLVGSLCTLSLARQYIPKAPNHKLGTLVEYLDLEKRQLHDALADVQSTLDVLHWIMNYTQMPLDKLVKLAAKPKVVYKMPFGKYKDRAIVSLPLDYIRYFDDKEIDHNLRLAFDQQIRLRS